MNKLTEAKCYEDIEKYIKDKGWDSKTIASKITWYGKSCGKYGKATQTKKESTRELHQKVYYWLCEYQRNYNNGVFFKQKKSAITMLNNGKSVKEVFEHFKKKDVQVSKVTLHKYQNTLLKVEGDCDCEGEGKKFGAIHSDGYCKYCEAYLYFQEGSSLDSIYKVFKDLGQEISKLRLSLIAEKVCSDEEERYY